MDSKANTQHGEQVVEDLMASLSSGPEAVAEREALLATAKADGWFAVKISQAVTAYMESTKGLIDGDTYRIIYAYGDGRVGVVERTHHTR